MHTYGKVVSVVWLLFGIGMIIADILIFPLAQVTVEPGEITVLGGVSYLIGWRILLIAAGIAGIYLGAMGITITSRRFGLGRPLTIKDLPIGKYYVADLWMDRKLLRIFQANRTGDEDIRLLEVDSTNKYSPGMKIEITEHDVKELSDLDPARFFKEGHLVIKKLT